MTDQFVPIGMNNRRFKDNVALIEVFQCAFLKINFRIVPKPYSLPVRYCKLVSKHYAGRSTL